MDDYTKHCIVLSNGQYAGTQQSEVDALFETFKQGPSKRLSIHFHGGLVSQATGMNVAKSLWTTYSADTCPIFFVWKSGIWETLPKIIDDVAKDIIFDRLIRHVMRFAEGKLNAEAVAGNRGVESRLTMQEVAEEYDKRKAEIEPFGGLDVVEDPEELDVHDKAEFEKALKADPLLQKKLAAIAADAAGGQPTGDRAAVPKFDQPATPDTMLSASIIDEIKEEGDADGQRSVAALTVILKYGWKIVKNVVLRFIKKRDHGLYCTAVEEILRTVYVDKLGSFTWKEIKDDTEEAFTKEIGYGGYGLMLKLNELDQAGLFPERVTLIGHSTGAIYICHFLDAAKEFFPDKKFEVVFLAPACTCELFAKTIAEHQDRIHSFRMFAMSDEVERKDNMVRFVYPRSLLYFVSGLLEPSEVDKPLVGMQRYLTRQRPFDGMADVKAVTDFLEAGPNRCVFSVSDTLDGNRSTSRAHGDFDNDIVTVASLGHILKSGF